MASDGRGLARFRARPREHIFISVANADRPWARWVAQKLRAVGYRVEYDEWSWRAGSSFIENMESALASADRVLAIVSPAYMDRATFGREEREAALRLAHERDGLLVPVLVAPTALSPIFARFSYIDLTGLDELAAAERLLSGLSGSAPSIDQKFPWPGLTANSVQATLPTVPLQSRFPGNLPAVWNVPPRLPTFTDRTEVLERIHAEFAKTIESPSAVVLRGMGGVGKTQVAVEYAWRHAAEYSLVWWVNASSRALLGEKIAALAAHLRIPEGSSTGEVAAAVLDALARRHGWLLILDNLEDAADLQTWRPRGSGHVLVTSRSSGWGGLAARIDVEVFSRSDAVRLIRRRIQNVDGQTADELADELGDLPLALAQASAYVEESEIPPTTYLKKFRARRAAMLSKGEDLVYGGSLQTAWSFSIERLREIAPAAVQMLEIAAVLAPEPIPISLFASAPELLWRPLRDIAGEDADADVDLDDVVASIVRYSLAVRRAESIVVHRLVQATILSNVSVAYREVLVHAATGLLVAAHPEDPRAPSSWDGWERLGPHLLHTAEKLGQEDEHGLRRVIDKFFWHLHARGKNTSAKAMAVAVWRQRTQLLGVDNPDTLRAASNVAVTMRTEGDYTAAQNTDLDVLARRQRTLGEHDPETMTSASNLAADLYALGLYGEARKLDEETWSRRRELLGADHPDTLVSGSNLAADLNALGLHEAARALDEEVLTRRHVLLGPLHPETLASTNNLGVDLNSIGAYDEARRLHAGTLKSLTEILGNDHPDTLSAASNLAVSLFHLGDYEGARTLDEATWARRRARLGEEHPDTLVSAHNLAVDLHAMGAREDAWTLYRETLGRMRRILGDGHPLTLAAADSSLRGPASGRRGPAVPPGNASSGS